MMQIFKTDSVETVTKARSLKGFAPYAAAEAELIQLQQQQRDLANQLALARAQMVEVCRGKAIPPRGYDDEVHRLTQRLTALQAQMSDAENKLANAQAQGRTAISKAAKPEHDRLRVRVITALQELQGALDAEQQFRDGGDYSTAVISAVRILDLDHDTLEAIIEGQRGYLR